MLSDLVHERFINRGFRFAARSVQASSPHSGSYGLPYKIAMLKSLGNRRPSSPAVTSPSDNRNYTELAKSINEYECPLTTQVCRAILVFKHRTS